MNDADITAGTQPGSGRPRLLDSRRESMRVRYYSRRTEETYLQWIKSLPRSRKLGLAGDLRAPTLGNLFPWFSEGAVLPGKLRDRL